MSLANAATANSPLHDRPVVGAIPMLRSDPEPMSSSAVSWGAIVAGAIAAAVLSLILLILGTGLGLSSISPWNGSGVSAATFGLTTILWVTFTQLVASGMGGYLAGRLRTKWADVHTDEIYFRDTAHGFLAWAVASLVTAAMLTSVISTIVGGSVQAGATVAGGAGAAVVGAATATQRDGAGGSMSYFVDALFRPEPNAATASATDGSSAQAAAEVTRIFANTVRTSALPTDDVRYIGQMVAHRTGIPQADAEKRVTDVYARAQQQLKNVETAARNAADQARVASAYAALWLFVSLLAGAFVASLAATFGGRHRDD